MNLIVLFVLCNVLKMLNIALNIFISIKDLGLGLYKGPGAGAMDIILKLLHDNNRFNLVNRKFMLAKYLIQESSGSACFTMVYQLLHFLAAAHHQP